MLRVIVSGTRRARREHLPIIGEVLRPICTRDPGIIAHGDGHGDPGVDHLATHLATVWGWAVRAVPAAWADCNLSLPRELGGCPPTPHRKPRRSGGTYCPLAGHRRNQALVDLQPAADHVLAFPAVGRSPGTWDLVNRARRAGLNVHPPRLLEV